MNKFIVQQQERLALAKIIEEHFAKNLIDPVWPTQHEDMYDHWDVSGKVKEDFLLKNHIKGDELRDDNKFDVKGLKKFHRKDDKFMDDMAWVEAKNVNGSKGWISGKADYIVFERICTWLIANRLELLHLVNKKVKDLNFMVGKKPYHIYSRSGRSDKITLVPFKDIKSLPLTTEPYKVPINEMHS